MKPRDGTIDSWMQSDIVRSHKVVILKQLYELQAKFLYNQYEPVQAIPSEAGIPFIKRLDRWVGGFDSPEDQWSAFSSLKYFFFIGQQETDELYRCAVYHKVLPWLSDEAGLDIFSADFESRLDEEIKGIWPCPVTDSLRINSLLHRTSLNGQSLRPDWFSLKEFGDKTKIKNYVERKKVKYLVLFEDFSGSGFQCERVANYALDAFPGKILLSPLVICHPGDDRLKLLASNSGGRLTYKPVVILGADCLIREDPTPKEPDSFSTLRKAIQHGGDIGKLSDIYGYDGVGSLVSTYSNCPNNTPSIFHATTSSWPFPLFPRKRRV